METADTPSPAASPGTWPEQAACTTTDPEIFFPGRRSADAGGEAKAICANCPVRVECLEYALATRQEWGVWGGTNEHERQAILWARQRQRSQPGALESPTAGAA